MVVAAGNSNANASSFSPASCNNVITVGASDKVGGRSIWNLSANAASNYGVAVDVAAPGSAIISTLNIGATAPEYSVKGGKPPIWPGAAVLKFPYSAYNGTSMAAPHVAGVVALIQSAVTNPVPPAQVEAIIESTATAFPATPSQPIGTGIVNAERAIEEAIRIYGSPWDHPDPENGGL